MTCPFCHAEHPELISLFGSQLLMSQYRCTRCGSYFEGIREDRHDLGEADLCETGQTGSEKAP
jgi:hypothetical protein